MVQRFCMLKPSSVINLLQRSLNVHEKFKLFLHRFKFVDVNKDGYTFAVLSDDERSFSILNLLNKISNSSSNF